MARACDIGQTSQPRTNDRTTAVDGRPRDADADHVKADLADADRTNT
ncbi:hypothetical protein [Streptomyces sp. NPDC020489]